MRMRGVFKITRQTRILPATLIRKIAVKMVYSAIWRQADCGSVLFDTDFLMSVRLEVMVYTRLVTNLLALRTSNYSFSLLCGFHLVHSFLCNLCNEFPVSGETINEKKVSDINKLSYINLWENAPCSHFKRIKSKCCRNRLEVRP